ncbi:hypothetical protein P9112_006705 [Eukaryota sp. TZLM1-RC]
MTVLSFALSIFHKFFASITLSASEELLSSCASLSSIKSLNESRLLKLPCRDLPSECTSNSDPTHREQFLHRTPCPNGNSCLMKKSLTHSLLNKHPERWRFNNCELHGKNSVHDSMCRGDSFSRPSLCPQGMGCSNRASCLYSHERIQCPNPNCVDLTSDHLNSFNHSPLAEDPFVYVESRGVERFVCPHGRSCNSNEPQHTEKFIHIVRPECLGCASSDEVHLSLYHHVGVKDLRPLCPNGAACKDQRQRDLDHIRKFSHPTSKAFDVVGNLIPPTRGPKDKIDFSFNVDWLASYCCPPNQPTPPNIASIAHFILGLKPVHRIKVEPFLSCLVHGNFYSLEFMKSQLSHSENVQSIAKNHFKLHKYSNRAAVADYVALAAKNKFLGLRNFSFDYGAQQEAKRLLMMNDTTELDELADSIAEAANELNNLANKKNPDNKIGIGYNKDKELGTDKTVFTNLGPNTYKTYGPIAIFFTEELTKHPASFLHLTAATYHYSQPGLKYRSHVPVPGEAHTPERIDFYYKLVQNLGCLKAAETLAWDLAKMVVEYREQCQRRRSPRFVTDVTIKDCLTMMFQLNSHNSF